MVFDLSCHSLNPRDEKHYPLCCGLQYCCKTVRYFCLRRQQQQQQPQRQRRWWWWWCTWLTGNNYAKLIVLSKRFARWGDLLRMVGGSSCKLWTSEEESSLIHTQYFNHGSKTNHKAGKDACCSVSICLWSDLWLRKRTETSEIVPQNGVVRWWFAKRQWLGLHSGKWEEIFTAKQHEIIILYRNIATCK